MLKTVENHHLQQGNHSERSWAFSLCDSVPNRKAKNWPVTAGRGKDESETGGPEDLQLLQGHAKKPWTTQNAQSQQQTFDPVRKTVPATASGAVFFQREHGHPVDCALLLSEQSAGWQQKEPGKLRRTTIPGQQLQIYSQGGVHIIGQPERKETLPLSFKRRDQKSPQNQPILLLLTHYYSTDIIVYLYLIFLTFYLLLLYFGLQNHKNAYFHYHPIYTHTNQFDLQNALWCTFILPSTKAFS